MLWQCCESVTTLPHCYSAISCSTATTGSPVSGEEGGREGGREGHPHSSPPQSTPHTTHCPHQATPATTGGAQAQIRGSKLTINQVQLAYLRVSYGGFECGYKLLAGYQSCFTQIFKLFCCGTTELWLAVTP